MADTTLPVLRTALTLLQERGWTQHYSSYSAEHDGPINIRTALSLAVADLKFDEHNAAYISAAQALTVELGSGIADWENGVVPERGPRRPRYHDEVVATLTVILREMETNGPKRLSGLRHGSSGFGAQPAGKRNT